MDSKAIMDEALMELLEEEPNRKQVYAMYMLAQSREVKAFPLIIRLARLPGETLESVLREEEINSLGRVLASVSGGDAGPIQALIEDAGVDQWVRGAALDGLMALVVCGKKPREEVVGYFGELLRGRLEREGSAVWDSLAQCVCDLFPFELMDDVRRAYADDLIDGEFIGWERFEAVIEAGREKTLGLLRRNVDYHLIDSLPGMAQKVGRNDPCPCGSGKKYKKCHGG